MIKKLLLITIILLGKAVSISAQDTYVVQQFGNGLSNWASSRDTYSALKSMEKLCSETIRISDNIMMSLASQNGLAQSEDYTWGNFVSCMQKEVDKGVAISLSNVEITPGYLIPDKYRGRKDLRFVSCNLHVSGASNFSENDLFILVDGKIAKIQEYKITVDKKGRHKLHIDLSGIELDEDSEGFSLTYNYSKAFPVGASVAYAAWKFMISMDLGFNSDKDIYTTQKVEFTNIVDYKITRGEYDLKYFITATPAYYMKYFAVGWGLGCAYFDGSESMREYKLEKLQDGTVMQTSGTSHLSSGRKYKFMMRPTVKGYIPCSDRFFISLSVNYDWIVGFKEKSCIGFGAGVHFLID